MQLTASACSMLRGPDAIWRLVERRYYREGDVHEYAKMVGAKGDVQFEVSFPPSV